MVEQTPGHDVCDHLKPPHEIELLKNHGAFVSPPAQIAPFQRSDLASTEQDLAGT